MRAILGALAPSLIAAGLMACAGNPSAGAEDSLIPRSDIFSENTRYDAAPSADGHRFAYSAAHSGQPAVWVGPIDGSEPPVPVTRTGAAVPQFSWSADPEVIFVIGDNAGDERWQISALNLVTGDQVDLTPGEGERAFVLGVSPSQIDQVLIASNERDAAHPDLYRVNIHTGDRERVFENSAGYVDFLIDRDLLPRLGVHVDADTGDYRLDVFEQGGEVRALTQIAYPDIRGFELLSLAADGRAAFLRDSTGRDTSALVELDLANGEQRVLASRAEADIVEVIVDPASGAPLAYAHDYAGKVWESLAVDSVFGQMEERWDGRIDFVEWSANDHFFTLYVSGEEPAYYLVGDRRSGDVRRLLDIYPDLTGHQFTRKQAERIRTRDGEEMVAWLTLPHGADADGDGRPDQPVPMIVMPHGGPWDQSREAFDPWQQWLADRGYAVLSPNFRGSTGYGKAWLNAGDLGWGGVIEDDVIDAARWAEAEGIAAPGRVGIWGASFGGYMVLRTLSNSPGAFACGASGAGTTDLTTLYESLPAYWSAFRAEYRQRVADPTTEAGRELARAQSPLFQADRINVPLVIAQGAEDSRVPRTESEQIVEAMTNGDQPVTYLLFEGEGHGNRMAANNRAHIAILEQFFADCLGGRAEPIGNALVDSTLRVPAGAGLIAGLQSALDQVASN